MKTSRDGRLATLLTMGCRALLIATIELCAVTGLRAQLQITPEVIANAGGFTVGGGISMSWTIGQMVSSTTTGVNGLVLTQGFQQPAHYFVQRTTSDIPNNPVTAGSELGRVGIAPHPVHTSTTLSWERGTLSKIEIYDLNGTLLHTEEISDGAGFMRRHELDMRRLPSATYLVRLHGLSGGIYEAAVIKVD